MTLRAVSVSIGSSSRDKKVQTQLFGQAVQLERIGTDGDLQQARRLFRQLDGEVQALGVGGTDLGLEIDGTWYRLHSVAPLVADVKSTPVVDGSGLKHTLEGQLAAFLEASSEIPISPKRVLITSGADRWGMSESFISAGYECIFGDLMFALGLPLPLRSKQSLKRLATVMIPLVSRLPFSWLYPTGEAQETWTPKWGRYYQWASVIAGDCHYVKRYMPRNMEGKTIVTNTTTPEDAERFRQVGVHQLVTSTPVLEGRSFGTNLLEAGLVAAAGLGRPLTREELAATILELDLKPQLRTLQDS